MGWMGKIVGGTLGMAIGGPLGAIFGAAFGHAFDTSPQQLEYQERSSLSPGEQSQLTFFVATFSMLAKLAKADGVVTEEEVASVESFMVNDLRLSPHSRNVAMNIFNTAIHSPEDFSQFATQFYQKFALQPQMLELMIDMLLRVAIADGNLSQGEEDLIEKAVFIFRFHRPRFEQLKSKYIKRVEPSYAVLGCDPSDSSEMIKKQYRKLVHEYHPDKIAAKGLPEEFTTFAEDKFREIQEAYEAIKQERGIK